MRNFGEFAANSAHCRAFAALLFVYLPIVELELDDERLRLQIQLIIAISVRVGAR
jgi:hypothetical protein